MLKKTRVKNGKYRHNISYHEDGKFDSDAEYRAWLKLKRAEENGLIKDLQRQVQFVLIPKSQWGGEIKYIADYVWLTPDNKIVVADWKSPYTAKDKVFSLKARLFAEKFGQEIIVLQDKR